MQVKNKSDKVLNEHTSFKLWFKSKFKRRKTQPWNKFLPKVGAVLGAILVAGGYFMARYEIVYDPQEIKCIPEYDIYLLDKWDKKIERDNIYVFHARNTEPVFEDGTKLMKFARGMPGDKVEVTPDSYEVKVNDVMLFDGLPLVERLEKEHDSFVVEGTLSDKNYWFFGTSNLSFDSRYWGAVNEEQVIGRAYPLF